MDKRIRLFVVLVIALVLLATPAAAYKVSRVGTSNDIQVKYSYSEALILSTPSGSLVAAYSVMNLAKKQHMTVNRNIGSIASEIALHAFFYLNGWNKEAANPADIWVNEGNWDYLP